MTGLEPSFTTRFSYDVYYQINLPKRMPEETKERLGSYLEDCLLESIQRVCEVSKDFVMPPRFYNVKTEVSVVKRIAGNGERYDECGLVLIGECAKIELPFVVRMMNAKKKIDFTRFVIDDILSKTGFLSEDVGRFMFTGSTNVIRHYLLFSLGKAGMVRPRRDEYVTICVAFFSGIETFVRAYIYSDTQHLRERIDGIFGYGTFDALVNETDKDKLSRLVGVMCKDKEKDIRSFARSLGYSLD